MRKVTVTGYLGADPEFKTTKNGASYVSFRLANHETIDKDENGNQITYWYSVTVWDSALQNMCKSMKKGSSVIVDGDITDRVYTSQKTGMPEIGRDIRAKEIYFNSNGKRDDAAPASAEAHVAKAPAPAASQASVQAAPQSVQPAQVEFADGDGDDLPF